MTTWHPREANWSRIKNSGIGWSSSWNRKVYGHRFGWCNLARNEAGQHDTVGHSVYGAQCE